MTENFIKQLDGDGTRFGVIGYDGEADNFTADTV